MGRSIGVNDLAREIDRSPSQVNRLCQRHLNCSSGHWIAGVKVEFCCQQLRSTRLSIAEVASQAGFEDQFYFSRMLKKHVGVSPLKYRQQQSMI